MQMKKITGLMMLGSLYAAGIAKGALIASESFWTTNAAPANGEYRQGSIAGVVSTYDNTVVTAGNSGFNAAKPWVGNTSGIAVTEGTSLTHNGLVGGSKSGALTLTPFASATGNRQSNRSMVSVPTSGSYYISGLTRGTSVANEGAAGTVGFLSSISGNTFDISKGVHFGFHVDGGKLHLSAFANNSTYNLVNLSDTGLTAFYQVVMKLDVNASGNESLTVWYAKNGDANLTLGLATTDIGDFWSSAADIGTFAAQIRGAGSSNKSIGYVDEVRFGTTLGDVTAIPEPATLGLFTLSSAALLLARRCLTR